MAKEYRSDDSYVKVKESDSEDKNKADVYVGSRGSDSGRDHCHYWVDKKGDSGMVHRGGCDDCSDSNDKGSGK
jgi:hypothetical protein